VLTTEGRQSYPGKADEEELEHLLQSDDGDEENDDYSEENPKEQVEINVKKTFQFLGKIDDPGSRQFEQAILNIDNNADALQELISSFMTHINKLKGASYAITAADRHVIPVIKIAVSTFGSAVAGGVVDIVSHAFKSWIGAIFETSKDVIERTCADVQMALCNSALYEEDERNMKSLAATYFRKLYNTLLIELYADEKIPKNVVNFLSEKLRVPQLEVARSCNEVISFLELHEQVSKLKAQR
jgi:hypothetical protein